MGNVVFTSVGTGGDIYPMLRIGERLRSRGHDVTLLTHAPYAGLAREAGLDFAALDTAEEHAASIDDGPLVNTPQGVPEFFRRHYFPTVRRDYELIRERSRARDTVVVVRDLFDVGARLAAETLGVPVAWMFVSPSQLMNTRLRRELFEKVLSGDVNRLREGLGLRPVRDWPAWLAYSGASLALWADWFAPPDPSWPASVTPVGFVLDNAGEKGEIPQEIRSEVESGERLALITGGTGTFAGTLFFEACVEACRRSGRRAILVTPHDELVPADLPASIRRYRRLPLGKLMPLMDVVLHHGGRGTLGCALASGIAQVILSWGADRPENALRAEAAGVAKSLPRASWRAEAVADAMESVSTPQVRNRCREIARRFAETDAPATASRVIEDALASAVLPPFRPEDIPPAASEERRELLALLLRKQRH